MQALAPSLKLPLPVRKLGKLFEASGHEIRAVGGWVRDSLQGIEAKDFDLATTATPDQMADIFEANNLRYFDTGIKHGTMTVLPTVQDKYEITTLRVDRETDGRHAEVEFTTDWRADAARRDFTINALSADLDGKVYDYFDGIRDLNDKRIVFVGDPAERIREDFLRILRYYRFKQRIGDRTRSASLRQKIRENLDGMQRLSVERIWMEMSKILSGHQSMFCSVVCDMLDAGVLEAIGLGTVDRYDVVRATITRDQTAHPVTVLAALTGKPMGPLWKMSSRESTLLEFLQGFRTGECPSLATLKEIAFEDDGMEMASELAAMFGPSETLNSIRAWRPPLFPVRGQHLLDMGYTPGPHLGPILDRLIQAWKDSDYRLNKEALLALVGKVAV